MDDGLLRLLLLTLDLLDSELELELLLLRLDKLLSDELEL